MQLKSCIAATVVWAAVAAPIQPLAWELMHDAGAAQEKKKKKKKKELMVK